MLLSLAELLGMSLWFSASAVVPALRVEWNLSDSSVSWLTIAVQLGFVCGTLLSAFLNLPDVISVRYLFAASALAGALTNAAFGAYAHNAQTGIVLRFLTGMFLAGVYPPGMKIMATWFQRSRGMALGMLVGALTLGKASPYLVNGLGSPNWRQNIFFISLLAMAGGFIVLLFVGDGPHAMPAAKFDWKQAVAVFSNRGVRLASFGYFGPYVGTLCDVGLDSRHDSSEPGCVESFSSSGRVSLVSRDWLRRSGLCRSGAGGGSHRPHSCNVVGNGNKR